MKISEDKLKQMILEELMLEADEEQFPNVGDVYEYTHRYNSRYNLGHVGVAFDNNKPPKTYKVEKSFKHATGKWVVEFENHAPRQNRTSPGTGKVGLIPWDEIKDHMKLVSSGSNTSPGTASSDEGSIKVGDIYKLIVDTSSIAKGQKVKVTKVFDNVIKITDDDKTTTIAKDNVDTFLEKITDEPDTSTTPESSEEQPELPKVEAFYKFNDNISFGGSRPLAVSKGTTAEVIRLNSEDGEGTVDIRISLGDGNYKMRLITVKDFNKYLDFESDPRGDFAASEDENYKELAQKLFPNLYEKEDGIDTIKKYWPDAGSLRAEKHSREQLKIELGYDGDLDLDNDDDVDDEDIAIYNRAMQQRKDAVDADEEDELENTTWDDLLRAAGAASGVETDVDTEDGSRAETETDADDETAVDAETDAVDTEAGTETDVDADDPEEGDKKAEISEDFTNAYNSLVNDFYDQTFLYEQGLLLKDFRDQLKTQKEPEREVAFTRPPGTEEAGKRDDLMEENKLKSIKTKIKTFVAQYIKLNKILKRYLKAAEEGLLKTKRLKKMFEQKLLDFMNTGKDLLQSLQTLLEPSSAGKRDDLTEADDPEEEKPFQQVAKFIDKITSDFDNLVKDPSTVTEEDFTNLKNETLQNINKIIIYFPNAKPFATVADEDEDEINDYNEKFKEIYNDHLRGNIARFKEILSGDANRPTVQALVTGVQDFLVDSANLFGVEADADGDAELTTEPSKAVDEFGSPALEGESLRSFIGRYRVDSSFVEIDGNQYQVGDQIQLTQERILQVSTTSTSPKDKLKFFPNRKYTIEKIIQRNTTDDRPFVSFSIVEQGADNTMHLLNDSFKQYFKEVEIPGPLPTEENLNKKLTTKLEILVEQFINKRKQQWQKRTT